MDIKVTKSHLSGAIAVPGSKSHSIRAAACATLAQGTSHIHAPLDSDDTRSCLKAAAAFGADVQVEADGWKITGTGGQLKNPGQVIDMGNSGTSLRIFTGLAATAPFRSTFDGDASLRTRPMKQLLDALIPLQAKVESNQGKCPVSVQGPLRGGSTEIVGTSSQFLTALLFAAPLAIGDVDITVLNLNEKPYVEITLGWLDRLGIRYTGSPDLSHFHIPGGQQYPRFDWTIPADFSTAAFPLTAAAITDSRLDILNLDFSDTQGDKAVFDYFRRMGMSVTTTGNSTSVERLCPLTGVDLDLNATPDALPAMAVAGACAAGTTRLLNVPQARIKETDRIACMAQELTKMGGRLQELPDGLIIHGGPLQGAIVDGHADHRIVMALALAGMVAEGETVITGAEAAAVTYPDFITDFQKLGANIQVIER